MRWLCPNVETCDNASNVSSLCEDSVPHEYDHICDTETQSCPKCIPYNEEILLTKEDFKL